MYWTPLHTRHKTKTNNLKHTTQYVFNTPYTRHTMKKNKTKNTTQYVLDTTMRKQTQIT
jgi:hypothetical protein